MAFEFKVSIPKTKELLRAIAFVPAALEEEMADAFDHAKNKFFKTWARGTRIRFTPRKGMLNRFYGIVDRRQGNIDALKMRVFTFSTVAEVHEKGGTIQARGGGFMRIPIPGSSVTTVRGRVKKAFRKDLRGDSRFFYVPRQHILYREFGGSNARAEPAFVFKSRVRVRPRLNFGSTWDGLRNFRTDRFNKAITRALSKVARKK